LIAQSDTVVFVVSPEAVKSERCVWEVDRTIELSKRLLPVIFKPVPEHDIPEKLSRVQFVRFDSGPGLSELAAALRVDLHWIREYTRLGEMAARWDGRGRPESLLLRGDDLDAAKAWMAARKAEAPEITVAQRAFVKASEEAETTRLGKERAQLETIAAEQRARAQSQRRFACALLVLGVLVLGGLLAAMLQARETAHREAKVMTSVAQRAIQEGHHDRAMRIALQGLPPEGSLALVTSWSDGRAKLAGGALLSGPHVRLKGHEGSIVHAAFSPGGERVVTAANDGTARIWEVDTGREIAVLNHEGGRGRYIWRASFSPDGTRVLTATADDRTARVWDAATGKEIVALKGHEGTVWTAAFSPDGRRAVTSSEDRTAQVWNVATGQEIVALKGHEDDLNWAVFSPNGAHVVTASDDRTARVWDAATGRELLALKHQGRVGRAAFSPNGTRVVTLSDDLSAHVWDAATGNKVAVFKGGHQFRVSDMTISSDSALVVTGSDRTAWVWDAETGQEIAALEGHQGMVRSVAFSPVGALVVTGADEGKVRVWDAKTGREIAVLQGHDDEVKTVAFSSDGARVVTGSADGTAQYGIGQLEGQSPFTRSMCQSGTPHLARMERVWW